MSRKKQTVIQEPSRSPNRDEETKELSHIIIKGAREHNLKNIHVELPKKKLIVFTGVSGSGKSI